LGGVAHGDELGMGLAADDVGDASVGVLGLVVKDDVVAKVRLRKLPLLEVGVMRRPQLAGRAGRQVRPGLLGQSYDLFGERLHVGGTEAFGGAEVRCVDLAIGRAAKAGHCSHRHGGDGRRLQAHFAGLETRSAED
jgi:hypothetical protein